MAEANQAYLCEGSPAMLVGIVDRAGLRNVLFALEHICFEKANHLEENWQDPRSAKLWSRYGRFCGTTACRAVVTSKKHYVAIAREIADLEGLGR
jgi:hypothetical protein